MPVASHASWRTRSASSFIVLTAAVLGGLYVLGAGCSQGSPGAAVGAAPPAPCPVQCPYGTVCGVPQWPPSESCQPGPANPGLPCSLGGAVMGVCQLAVLGSETASVDALLKGFDVPSFSLQSTGATYTWSAPAGVSIVACGLFRCLPSFDVNGISNAEQCLLSKETYQSSNGSYTPAMAPLYAGGGAVPECRYPLEAGADAKAGDAGKPLRFSSFSAPVTFAAVGCWAFDTSHVVYATPLYFPSIANLAGVDGFDPTCATQSVNGAVCSLADGGFGTCFAHACAQRCVFPSDCVRPTPYIFEQDDAGRLVTNDAGAPIAIDGGACPAAACNRSGSSYIGTCSYPGAPSSASDGGGDDGQGGAQDGGTAIDDGGARDGATAIESGSSTDGAPDAPSLQ